MSKLRRRRRKPASGCEGASLARAMSASIRTGSKGHRGRSQHAERRLRSGQVYRNNAPIAVPVARTPGWVRPSSRIGPRVAHRRAHRTVACVAQTMGSTRPAEPRDEASASGVRHSPMPGSGRHLAEFRELAAPVERRSTKVRPARYSCASILSKRTTHAVNRLPQEACGSESNFSVPSLQRSALLSSETCQARAPVDCSEKISSNSSRDSWVLDQDALLAIEPRRSRIEVVAADEYNPRVDGQRFRVQARTG